MRLNGSGRSSSTVSDNKSGKMRKIRRCHIFVLLSFFSSFLLVTLWVLLTSEEGTLYRVAAPILMLGGLSINTTTGIECYFDEDVNNIDEIEQNFTPAKSSSIFFHETSCHGHQIVLTPRQACAVESAAKMNPQSEVYLLFTSPINMGNNSVYPELIVQLLKYQNIKVLHLDFEKYFVGTPLEGWYKNGALKRSRWPKSHSSDVLRFLTLWKYGGTYLDLDVVVTKSFKELNNNFAGAESSLDVAAGVLNFAADGEGHKMATACLEDLRTEFRGDDWGNNGPGVITRVLKRMCQSKFIPDMTAERCNGFTVHSPVTFYPIPWRQWKLYFDEFQSNRTMMRIRDSYAIHVWNKFSITQNIDVGSRQPYGIVARKYCPRSYSHTRSNTF